MNRIEKFNQAMREASDLDVAIEILDSMREMADYAWRNAETNDERLQHGKQFALYNDEQELLKNANKHVRQSVYDKVFKFYAPVARWHQNYRDKWGGGGEDHCQRMLDYDVANEILAEAFVKACRRKDAAATDGEREEAERGVRTIRAEQNILNTPGYEDAKLSVYDKAYNHYAPVLRGTERVSDAVLKNVARRVFGESHVDANSPHIFADVESPDETQYTIDLLNLPRINADQLLRFCELSGIAIGSLSVVARSEGYALVWMEKDNQQKGKEDEALHKS